jgi:hypothetical protein
MNKFSTKKPLIENRSQKLLLTMPIIEGKKNKIKKIKFKGIFLLIQIKLTLSYLKKFSTLKC